MRVIAGSARGTPLIAPAGKGTRPTTDRAKGAIANALWSIGAIEGARLLDLFAGTGSMSIELLSRGAAHGTFVEHDRAALQALRTNLERTRLTDRATLVEGDAHRFLDRLIGQRAVDGAPRFDLVIADPPYAFDEWPSLLSRLVRTGASLIVAETRAEVDEVDGWHVTRSRRYSDTVVTFFARSTGAASPTTSPTPDQSSNGCP
jgi:16S rRNA (guanine966-N2)-methyltransferase